MSGVNICYEFIMCDKILQSISFSKNSPKKSKEKFPQDEINEIISFIINLHEAHATK